MSKRVRYYCDARGLFSCLSAIFVLMMFCSAPAYAVAPTAGASCASDTSGDTACYKNGCYVCTDSVWTPQAMNVGVMTTCTAKEAGMIHWSETDLVIEFCDGSNWAKITTDPIKPPVGSTMAWPADTVPSGYLECNGQAVSRTTYSDLYDVLGETYGSGDGSTTFNLPDLRGRFLRGYATSTSDDPGLASRTNSGAIGSTQETSLQPHTHTCNPAAVTSSSDGAHTHSYSRRYSTAKPPTGSNGIAKDVYTTPSMTSAGAHTHTVDPAAVTSTADSSATSVNETRPRNVNMMFVIKY